MEERCIHKCCLKQGQIHAPQKKRFVEKTRQGKRKSKIRNKEKEIRKVFEIAKLALGFNLGIRKWQRKKGAFTNVV